MSEWLSRSTVYMKQRICMGVYQFPVAAVTNYNTKPHKFIISQFSVLVVLHGFYWDKIKVLAGLQSFLEVPVENSFLCLFWCLEATYIPWLMAPSLHL